MSRKSKSTPFKKLGLSSKPREKGKLFGFHTLSDAELLAVLLRTGSDQRSAMQLAQQILEEEGGTLESVLSCSVEELSKIRGVGLGKAATICACAEIAKRTASLSHREMPVLKSPRAIFSYVKQHYRNARQEILRGLYLDTKKQLIRDQVLSKGGLNFAYLSAREVFQPAIETFADGFVIVHNHPSGDPSPSEDDRKLTQSLCAMGNLLKIPLVDHIIVGEEKYFSFAEKGLLS